MAVIKWNDSFSVSIDSIDEQHKKLIEVINKLYTAMSKRKAREIVGELIKEVKDYTEYHFSYEKGLMEKASYADLEKHKVIHKNFVSKIEDFLKRHEQDDIFLSIDVADFLYNWFINHIKGTDTKYIPTMKKSGIT